MSRFEYDMLKCAFSRQTTHDTVYLATTTKNCLFSATFVVLIFNLSFIYSTQCMMYEYHLNESFEKEKEFFVCLNTLCCGIILTAKKMLT